MTLTLKELHPQLVLQRMTLPGTFDWSPRVRAWWIDTLVLLDNPWVSAEGFELFSTPMKKLAASRTTAGLRNQADAVLVENITEVRDLRISGEEYTGGRNYALNKFEMQILTLATRGVKAGRASGTLEAIIGSLKVESELEVSPFLEHYLAMSTDQVETANSLMLEITHTSGNTRLNEIAWSYFRFLQSRPLNTASSTSSNTLFHTPNRGNSFGGGLEQEVAGETFTDIDFYESGNTPVQRVSPLLLNSSSAELTSKRRTRAPRAARTSTDPEPTPSEPGKKITEGEIFVVHGHNSRLKDRVKNLVRDTTGLTPVVLNEMPSGGKTLIEKFESFSNVQFAVVLLTADDLGGTKDGPMNDRARQNVIFEMGFFYGSIGRSRVATLLDKGVEKPSDVDGIVYISTSQDRWVYDLLSEIENVGIEVNYSKARFV